MVLKEYPPHNTEYGPLKLCVVMVNNKYYRYFSRTYRQVGDLFRPPKFWIEIFFDQCLALPVQSDTEAEDLIRDIVNKINY